MIYLQYSLNSFDSLESQCFHRFVSGNREILWKKTRCFSKWFVPRNNKAIRRPNVNTAFATSVVEFTILPAHGLQRDGVSLIDVISPRSSQWEHTLLGEYTFLVSIDILWTPENEKSCGNRRVFPQLFRALSNIHECLYLAMKLRTRGFYEQIVNEALPSLLLLAENEGE